MTVVLTLGSNLGGAAALTAVTESLPAHVRAGALGLIYAFAISVFGGSTQFVIAGLTRLSGNPIAPAWYMTAAVAVGLAAMILVPETAPRRRRR
jgi:hypothetical protein